ncbi:MAG: hypothetical protein LBL63_04025 [Clostridiales Family XIII bacterium]|jgi:hypothetical protein|nr:hypothetical protein [Clostridiales Family XIII bacterium]
MTKTSFRSRKRTIVALVLAVALALSMGISAFADTVTNYNVTLYDAGTYGTAGQNVSMGNGTMNGASYDDTTNTLVINVQNMTVGPYTGYIGSLTININGVDYVGTADVLPNPSTYTFTGVPAAPALNTAYAGSFTIVIPGSSHPGGTIVGADVVFS